jgi:hypothetical protein
VDQPQLPAPLRGITDTEVSDSQPYVRAEVVKRLEAIWKTCEPYIVPGEFKPDPRFMEMAVRVCDRLIRLYRLDQPSKDGNEGDPGSLVDVRELVRAQVAELETRMRAYEP